MNNRIVNIWWGWIKFYGLNNFKYKIVYVKFTSSNSSLRSEDTFWIMVADVVISEFVLLLLTVGISGRSSSELISINTGYCPGDGDFCGYPSIGDNSFDWGCHSSGHSSCDCWFTGSRYEFGVSGRCWASCYSADNFERCVDENNCKECWIFDRGDFWSVSFAGVLKSYLKIIISYSSSVRTVESTIKSQ